MGEETTLTSLVDIRQRLGSRGKCGDSKPRTKRPSDGSSSYRGPSKAALPSLSLGLSRPATYASHEVEEDTGRDTPAFLTRASLDRLRKERDFLKTENHRLQAIVSLHETTDRGLRDDLATAVVGRDTAEALEMELRQALAAAEAARDTAEARVARLEREVAEKDHCILDVPSQCWDCAAVRKEAEMQMAEARRLAAEAKRLATEEAQQRVQDAENVARSCSVKLRSVMAKTQTEAVMQRLVVHVISPSVALDDVPWVRQDPSHAALSRMVLEEILPKFSDVFVTRENDPQVPDGREISAYTEDVTQDLLQGVVEGIRKHVSATMEARGCHKQILVSTGSYPEQARARRKQPVPMSGPQAQASERPRPHVPRGLGVEVRNDVPATR